MGWGWDELERTIAWDGEPVRLANCVIERRNRWDWHGARNMSLTVVFENGWDCDVSGQVGGTLWVMGGNRRAIAAQQQLEETVPGRVGDRWDFSYLKTGYEHPGAYVQWGRFESDRDVDGQIVPVGDPADLQRRIDQVTGMASDPDDHSGYPQEVWA
jgi:hypothetical protein